MSVHRYLSICDVLITNVTQGLMFWFPSTNFTPGFCRCKTLKSTCKRKTALQKHDIGTVMVFIIFHNDKRLIQIGSSWRSYYAFRILCWPEGLSEVLTLNWTFSRLVIGTTTLRIQCNLNTRFKRFAIIEFTITVQLWKISIFVDTDQAALTVLDVIHGFGLPGVPWVSPMATGVTINH